MQNKFIFLDKRFDVEPSYIRLFIIIFITAVLAKGSVVFRGHAIDDYGFMTGVSAKGFEVILSQGRYISAAIIWLVDSIGVNIIDMYFSLGLVTLFLLTAFVVSILRFVGLDKSPAAGIVGAIIIAHPYLTETLTFRMALPSYCVALIFSIMALEMVIKSPATWGNRALALLATLAMLFTYQVFINYFAIAIIFAFIYGQVLHVQSLAANNVYRERAITLTIISTISIIAFMSLIWLTKALGLTKGTGRADLITFGEIPHRIEQISSSLMSIYWSAEHVFSGWLKILVALMLAISLIIIFWYLLTGKDKRNSISNVSLIFFAFLLLIPVSIGVILPFQNWWPVPRVIAHVSIIIGLIFLMADSCMYESANRFFKSAIFISRTIVLIGFIFLSNQILADQQRINQWDKMMANRIISRLEMYPNFSDVHLVYINGGSWGFPAKLRTVQGDMNASAFLPDYSKVPLLSEVSGYWLQRAVGAEAIVGEAYCKDREPWPHAESITVENDVAIICLKK